MDNHVGGAQLVEYIEEAADGSYCSLMGWPSQTELSIKSSQSKGATLESWYPETAPIVPSTLQWKPFKIVKAIPHSIDPADQNHPLRGTLRYHRDIGWHYRYFLPFKITGTPSLPSSMKSPSSSDSGSSAPKSQERSRKPPIKITREAFVKMKKIALSELPELRLRRIEQQPRFRSLTRLFTVQPESSHEQSDDVL